MRRTIVVLASAACVLAFCGPARADTTPEDLYTRGREALSHKDWNVAHELLERSWSMKQSFDTAALLGQTEIELRQYRDAAEHLDFALRNFPNKDPVAGARERIRTALHDMSAKVYVATLDVQPAGSLVVVDGKSVGRSPLAARVFLEPGRHIVEVRMTGYQSATQSVTATAGGTAGLQFALSRIDPAPSPAPSTVPAPPTRRDSPPATTPPMWPVWTGAAVAVAGVATGIGFRVAASSKQDDADRIQHSLPAAACAPGAPPNAACADLSDANGSVDSRKNLSTVSFVAGGAGAVFAVGYLIWRASKTPAETSMSPALLLGRRSAGVIVGGRF